MIQVLLHYLENNVLLKDVGKDLAAINRLLKQFEQSKQMMKQMSNMDMATGLPKWEEVTL